MDSAISSSETRLRSRSTISPNYSKAVVEPPSLRFLMMEFMNQQESPGCDGGGCWNGENPRPDNTSGHPPSNCRKSLYGAYADNCPSDGMGGAYWNTREGGAEQRDCAGALRTKPTNRL